MLVLAHAGHWIASLLYAAPVLVLVVALSVASLRDKRRARRATGPDPDR